MNDIQHIIVAEDNPRDREFLVDLLPEYAVRCAADGGEALSIARNYDEPWVVSDIQMPSVNGLEFARALWEQKPLARIVLWSHYCDEMYVRSLAKIIPPETVYGYVLKSNRTDIFLKAIKAVFEESQCWIDPKVRPVQARLQHNISSISDTEYEALIDIALGLTDNAIAKRRYLSRRGVQNRLKSLYAKLGIDHDLPISEPINETINQRVRAVAIALRRGLINKFVLEQQENELRDWIAQNDKA